MTVTVEMTESERKALMQYAAEASTVEELRYVVVHLTGLVLAMNRCCEGGPQHGHAWNCPKCPD